MTERTCPVDGVVFQTTSANKVYCSRRCYKRAMNHAQRTREGVATIPVDAPMVTAFDCAQCGTPCVPGENVAGHAARFCGELCKKRWHRAHQPYVKPLPQWPPTVGVRETARYKRVLRADPCAYCGTRPSGIDHIEPVDGEGADDWTNYTGCCQRCNGAKGTLPLLSALLWLPTSRDYHDLRRTLWATAA